MERTTEVIAFRLPPDLVSIIDEHAKIDRRTRANLLQVIVEDWIMDRVQARVLVDPGPGVEYEAGGE